VKRVLVAIDKSEYSVTAARAAVDLARAQPVDDLRFVHVVSLKPGQIGKDDYPERPDLPEDWPVFQEALAIAREAEVQVNCEVLFGHPAEMILHHAHKQKADLIVVGSLGESGIKEFLLGSVATRITARAPCAVLIVRPGFRLDP